MRRAQFIAGACAAVVLGIGPVAWAQTAGEKADAAANKAGQATKDAAHKTGQATKDAASKTGQAAKSAARKTGDATKDAAGATADATKDAAHKTGHAAKDAAGAAGEATRDAGEHAGNAAEKTGGAAARAAGHVDDGWITTKVKSKFAGSASVKASDINVDTKDGVVTLTGTVPTKAAHRRALSLARQTRGVKSVNDQLTVGSSAAK